MDKNLNYVGFPGGFAVLMAVYLRDDPRLLQIAIDSVFANTLKPDQFVLVADGPLSEDLENILTPLRIKYAEQMELLRLSVNKGLAEALNTGLKHISLPWVIRADADDLNLPHRFETLAKLLIEQPSLVLMSSAILEVDVKGQALAIRKPPVADADIRHFAKRRSPFNHMAVAYRRDVVLDCGGYPNVHLKEDYALWCRMLAKNHIVANSPEILVHATAGRDMYKRRGGRRYAKSEYDLQCIMVECGMKTKMQAWFDGLLRASVFLMPTGLRGVIFEKLLRTSPKKGFVA